MAGRWEEALSIMEDMTMEGVMPNSITYASAINACGQSRQLTRALDLLKEARFAGIQVKPGFTPLARYVNKHACIHQIAHNSATQALVTLIIQCYTYGDQWLEPLWQLWWDATNETRSFYSPACVTFRVLLGRLRFIYVYHFQLLETSNKTCDTKNASSNKNKGGKWKRSLHTILHYSTIQYKNPFGTEFRYLYRI